jgi:(2Fe-2S) ferredoxin
MKLCDHGPVVVVYPEGSWYGKVDEDAADAILDAIENGGVAEDFLLPS